MTKNNMRTIAIDSSAGGNGDVWMRLVGFYILAGLQKEIQIKILLPKIFRNLANVVFGDRLIIMTDEDSREGLLVYTSLGFVTLFKGMVQGTKYIVPYQRSIVHDKKKYQLKDFLNVKIFNLTNFLGIAQVPAWSHIELYQGFLDIVAIKKLRIISYENFIVQLKLDYDSLFSRLNKTIPISDDLVKPIDLPENILVFPTGTSRQFIPVWWAKKHLPNAYFSFFYKDKDAEAFKEQGLKIIYFYKEPGDIIELSKHAKWTITTDSFASHLLQYASERCTITITEVLKSRIISPAFKGHVIDSEVACHPCLHLDRSNHPYCAAGHTECLNWKNTTYTQNLLRSIA